VTHPDDQPTEGDRIVVTGHSPRLTERGARTRTDGYRVLGSVLGEDGLVGIHMQYAGDHEEYEKRLLELGSSMPLDVFSGGSRTLFVEHAEGVELLVERRVW